MQATGPARLLSPAYWRSLLQRFLERRRSQPVTDRAGLEAFIRTRAAHVAQTSLYGYLRTRAGTRFPELFSDDAFVASINIAKWHVWLDCVSDLSVFAGGLLRRLTLAPAGDVGALMRDAVESLLVEAGTPADAGPEYPAHADRVRARVALCDWGPTDDDAPFSQSPAALVHWAPIVDELKQMDEEIVRNSVRFRWQEVRRELARLLDAGAVMGAAAPASRDERGGG